MAAVVGFAFLWLSVTAVGKQVFLLVVATIPNAMLCMTTTAVIVQKAAFGRKKRPPLAVKKQLIVLSQLYTATDRNKVIIFLYRHSRTFFTANGGLFVFAAFQPATRQARMGGRGISESSLSRYLPTHTDALGEALKSHKSFCIFLWWYIYVLRKYS